jgi:ABC-type nitrate/sulfonate/bicarbonate transport system substrate-binding protein
MVPRGTRDAHTADKVTFVTDFGYNGRHAYYFVALEKGYYARQNLEVQIVRGQGSADAVKQVAAGTAQIGFADAAAVILGRGNDQIPTKLVAMVYAKPPHAIYVLKESGIAKPKDLEGKKVADTAFSAVPKLFEAYAKAANIDAGKVTWQPTSSHHFDVSVFGDPASGDNGPQRSGSLLGQTTSAYSSLEYGGHNQTVHYAGVLNSHFLVEPPSAG